MSSKRNQKNTSIRVALVALMAVAGLGSVGCAKQPGGSNAVAPPNPVSSLVNQTLGRTNTALTGANSGGRTPAPRNTNDPLAAIGASALDTVTGGGAPLQDVSLPTRNPSRTGNSLTDFQPSQSVVNELQQEQDSSSWLPTWLGGRDDARVNDLAGQMGVAP